MQGVFQRVGEYIMLHAERDIRGLHFFILIDDNYRLSIVGYELIYNGSFVHWVLDVAEKLFDLRLNLVHIDVAYDNQSLMIGVIPFVIIVDKFLSFEVIYHAHQTNREAQTIFTAGIKRRKITFEHAI